MKSALVIFGVLIAAVTANCLLPPPSKQDMDDCKVELKINGGIPSGPPNFDDPKGKCFHACLLKKSGDLDDGKIVLEKVLEKGPADDEEWKIKATECVKKATDECEIAATFGKCMFSSFKPIPTGAKPKLSVGGSISIS